MTLSGLDVVARDEHFEALASGCELRAWQWAFLHDLDGETQLRDAALRGGVDLDLALAFVAQCQTRGLVRVVEMTLDEFRRANGYDVAPHADAQAEDESLAGYEQAVPAWMMEGHDDASSGVPRPEPVAEWQPDAWQPDAWQPDVHIAHEPVAHETVAHEPVAHEPAAHEPAAYEPASEPVGEWQPDAWQPDAWQPDVHVAHEPVAESQAEAQPVMLEFGAEPVAEHDPSKNGHYVDASASVAGLMALEAPHEASGASDVGEDRPAVSFSLGGDAESAHGGPADWQHFTQYADAPDHAPVHAPDVAPEPVAAVAAASEEHAYAQYAYEPMSLVTTVDPARVHPDEPHVDAAPLAPAREQGSISFTFSPEMEAPPEPQSGETRQPEPMRADPAPPVRPASPSMQHVPSNPPPNPAPVKSDIVGNLIARALTFRIK